MISQINLLTYNFFIRPPGISSGIGDFKDARQEMFIKNEFEKYDIICFQEFFEFGSNRLSNFVTIAKSKGYHFAYGPRQQPARLFIDSGLVIASKYPILETGCIEVTRGCYSDWYDQIVSL